MEKVQCKFIKADGVRCSKMTSDASGLCSIHKKSSGSTQVKTIPGTHNALSESEIETNWRTVKEANKIKQLKK